MSHQSPTYLRAQAKEEQKPNIELVNIAPIIELDDETGIRDEPVTAVNRAVVGTGGRIKRSMVEALERDSAGRPTPTAAGGTAEGPVDGHVFTPLKQIEEEPAAGSMRGSSGRGSVLLHTSRASVHEASVHVEPPPSAQQDPDAANVERPASEASEQSPAAESLALPPNNPDDNAFTAHDQDPDANPDVERPASEASEQLPAATPGPLPPYNADAPQDDTVHTP